MKGKFLALPLAAVLLLTACGGNDDKNKFEVEDPLTEKGGKNDVGT